MADHADVMLVVQGYTMKKLWGHGCFTLISKEGWEAGNVPLRVGV